MTFVIFCVCANGNIGVKLQENMIEPYRLCGRNESQICNQKMNGGKEMKKRILALVLGLVMMTSGLYGCAGESKDTKEESKGEESA